MWVLKANIANRLQRLKRDIDFECRAEGPLSLEKVRAFYGELNEIIADDHEQWRAVRKLPPKQ